MKKFLILLAFILPLLNACKKDRGDNFGVDDWTLQPNIFFFQLLHEDGNILSEREMDSMKIFYINPDGSRQYEDPNEKLQNRTLIGKPTSEAIFVPNGIMVAAINDWGVQENTWYLEHIDGNIDTLYVESKRLSNKMGKLDPCLCTDPFTVVRLNGKDASIHPTLRPMSGKNVYILKP